VWKLEAEEEEVGEKKNWKKWRWRKNNRPLSKHAKCFKPMFYYD